MPIVIVGSGGSSETVTYTYAGHYTEAMIDLEGDALVSTPIKVYQPGGSTLATLYTSRQKTTAAANPATTDTKGNLSIWLDPGDYELAAVVNGTEQTRQSAAVAIDPGESAQQVADHGALTTGAHSGLVAQTDPRLADARAPTAGSVTDASVAADADIALSKLASDPLARAGHTGTQLAATVSDFNTAVRTNRLDQMAAPTAAVAMNGQKLTGLGAPTAVSDAATKGYADALGGGGFHILTAVRAATTANVNLTNALENGDTIDGVVLATGDRVLVKNQTAVPENGVYVVPASGAAARATDADSSAELVGADVFVSAGTVNALTSWAQQTPASIVVGTDPVVWAQHGAASSYVAGPGLTLTGNTFAVEAADSTITVASNSIKVATGGITAAQVDASLKSPAAGVEGLRALGVGSTSAAAGNDARLSDARVPTDGSVTNAKVASGAAIAKSKLNLAGTITNADIHGAAAIAYAKLLLTGSILNADLAGSIELSKLAEAVVTASGGGKESIQDHGSMGSTEVFDLSNGNFHFGVLSANCVFTFSGATAGKACSFTVKLTQDATGGRTITWPASVDWPGGIVPTPSTAPAKVSLWSFVSHDGGSVWYGTLVGDDFR